MFAYRFIDDLIGGGALTDEGTEDGQGGLLKVRVVSMDTSIHLLVDH